MTYADRIRQGHCVMARRGDEWLSIQPRTKLDENNEFSGNSDTEALWLYGTGKVGNGRRIAPMAVVDSQLAAHIDHGWQIVESLND